MKCILKNLLIFIVLFILSFACSYFLWEVSLDEVWNYGFAYNISQGFVPYRDFNMIILPFYPVLVSIFILVFGHHLYVIHLFNAIIVSFMIFCMWHKLGKKVILIIPIVLIYSFPGYNFLTLFLMIILINICECKFKNSEVILGVLISLLFLTKQTVGFCLLIPFLYYSKNKLKGVISFLVPICLLILYLLLNDALYECIDYCFLGMFDFVSDNKVLFFFFIEIFIIIIIFYKLVKVKFQDKILFFTLMYQVIMVPIFDFYHFMLCIILIYYVFLLRVDIVKYKLKYYFIMVVFASCFFCFGLNDGYCNYHLYSKKNSYLYARNISFVGEKNINEMNEYLSKRINEYDKFYLFTCMSYQIKLEMNLSLSKFDLINNGNMGYNGSIKYIDEIKNSCSHSSCLFVLYKLEFYNNDKSQTNHQIIDYIEENYKKIDEYNDFNFYDNLEGESSE